MPFGFLENLTLANGKYFADYQSQVLKPFFGHLHCLVELDLRQSGLKEKEMDALQSKKKKKRRE